MFKRLQLFNNNNNNNNTFIQSITKDIGPVNNKENFKLNY